MMETEEKKLKVGDGGRSGNGKDEREKENGEKAVDLFDYCTNSNLRVSVFYVL